MVKVKHEMLKTAIANSKMRIKHHEKHGDGLATMQDKKTLVRQEKKWNDLKNA